MNTPRVTVLMPVKNGGPFVAEAINSVVAQTFLDWELIVIENGSSDETLSIVSSLAETDDRIRVIEAGDIGLVAALNRGLAEARGEYVARMDADDLADPSRLERQAQYLDQHRSCVLVGTAYQYIDESGNRTGRRRVVASHGAIRAEMSFGNPFGHSTVMLAPKRTQVPIEYSDRYPDAEDFELWLRLSEQGEVANIPTPLLNYRVHSSSVTRVGGSRNRTSSIDALAERSNWEDADSIFRATFNPKRAVAYRDQLKALWLLNVANLRARDVPRRHLLRRSLVASVRPIRDRIRRRSARRRLRRQSEASSHQV